MKTRAAVIAAFTVAGLFLTPAIPLSKACGALAPSQSASLQSTTARVGGSEQAPRVGTSFEARIDALLLQSGYEFKKVKANSWYANLRGKQLTQIRILIGTGSNSLAVGAVVVPKRNLPVTTQLLHKMMKLSYDLNYVRVCLDPDDDLLVMSQAKDRALDLQEFKDTIERVAAAADRAYGEVRPFLSTP